MRLANKVAIVTGAGSGIGRASAIALAREGARVAVVDIQDAAGQQTVESIRQAGREAAFIHADVSQREEANAMVTQVLDQFHSIDVLHNNAGVAVRMPVAEQDEEGWDRCIKVNLKSIFLCCKFAIPHMLANGGSIINTSSVTGVVGVRNRAAYSTTKGGIVILTKNMALDYARFNIRVNCVCPGFVRTPLIDRIVQDPAAKQKLTALHPLGRLGTPEDIANAVVFLASNDSSWITGHALVVDGGFSVGPLADI